jgi:hypothetical protein
MGINETLLKRKEIVLKKLSAYGITSLNISYLPYLNFSGKSFQTPRDVGRRMLILWALSTLAHYPDDSAETEAWLHKANLWDSVSEQEKILLSGEKTKDILIDMSWWIEGAVVLGWAVNLVKELPGLETELSPSGFSEFIDKFPIDEDPAAFLETLTYRDKEEIFIENIVNEMITGHLRDLMLKGAKTKSTLNVMTSFERHKALNWVRKFSNLSEWDETDTST